MESKYTFILPEDGGIILLVKRESNNRCSVSLSFAGSGVLELDEGIPEQKLEEVTTKQKLEDAGVETAMASKDKGKLMEETTTKVAAAEGGGSPESKEATAVAEAVGEEVVSPVLIEPKAKKESSYWPKHTGRTPTGYARMPNPRQKPMKLRFRRYHDDDADIDKTFSQAQGCFGTIFFPMRRWRNLPMKSPSRRSANVMTRTRTGEFRVCRKPYS
jgi:hypothetical protein